MDRGRAYLPNLVSTSLSIQLSVYQRDCYHKLTPDPLDRLIEV
jgi:hypothetical protein